MESLVIIDREQACSISGGAGTREGRLARTLGRLAGAALKALYDLLTSTKDPKAQPAG